MEFFRMDITMHCIFSVIMAIVIFFYVFSKQDKKTANPVSRFCQTLVAIAIACWGLYYVPDLLGKTEQITGVVTDVSYTYYPKHLLSTKRRKRLYEITVMDSSGHQTILYDSNVLNYNRSSQKTPFLINQTYEFNYLPSSKILTDFNLKK